MAVWLVILFLEGTFVKLLEAECTHKMFWVKFTVHGSDAPACDRLLTAVAQCTSPGMIVHLTVWSAIMLKEASSWKGLMTFLERSNENRETGQYQAFPWCYTKHKNLQQLVRTTTILRTENCRELTAHTKHSACQ